MKKRIAALGLCFLLLLGQVGAVTVEEALALVEEHYVDEVPQAARESRTVEELFANLDKYSIYYPPKGYEQFLNSMNDVKMEGVGIVSRLSEDGTALEILRVYEDGSAYAKGIVPGDRVLAVDGKKVASAATSAEAAGWITGRKDTPVTLTIKRADGGIIDVTMLRAPFTITYTNFEMWENGAGYISCESFGNQTYDRFVQALEQCGGEAERWIVDLRDNGGGMTQGAMNAVGIFTGAGLQSMMQDRTGTYYAINARGNTYTMYPALVLVNGASASASEQFAAAIRDRKGGVVIGSRTYGKGTAQVVIDQAVEPEMFPDGDAVRITAYRFYSPAGLVNDTMGVLPHLEVDAALVEDVALLLRSVDPQKENENVLRLHIGEWRFFVYGQRELEAGGEAALEELLEAMLPDAEIYWGMGNGEWEKIAAEEAARRIGLSGYEPRWFADAEGSPYRDALNALKTVGILRGDEHGNVDPEGILTRAELCAMLAQALGAPAPERDFGFVDVPGDAWYADAVNAMAAMGFMEGDGTAFYPEEELTCEQLIAVLSRISRWMSVERCQRAKTGPGEEMLADEGLAAYSDWAKPAAWLMGRSQYTYGGEYVNYLWADVSEIDPAGTATRGEAAYALWRTMDLVGILRQ